MPDFASILIVDDDETVRNALRSVLEKFDYDCVFAQNGVEALACLTQSPFDLVVTDLAMPQMDGLTLLARIQEMPTTPTVVVLTGHTEIHMALDASHRGAFDYIVKPSRKINSSSPSPVPSNTTAVATGRTPLAPDRQHTHLRGSYRAKRADA
jgi:DNA-binding NtrC family response regulator